MAKVKWLYLRQGSAQSITSWATRELAQSVVYHQELPAKVVPYGDRFAIQVRTETQSTTIPKSKKLKPFTRSQYNKWVEDQRGWGQEMDNDKMGVSPSDAVYDIVESMVRFPDEETRRAIAYLKSSGVTDVKGRIADDLFEVAY